MFKHTFNKYSNNIQQIFTMFLMLFGILSWNILQTFPNFSIFPCIVKKHSKNISNVFRCQLGVECSYTNKSDGQNCSCLIYPIGESSVYECFQGPFNKHSKSIYFLEGLTVHANDIKQSFVEWMLTIHEVLWENSQQTFKEHLTSRRKNFYYINTFFSIHKYGVIAEL